MEIIFPEFLGRKTKRWHKFRVAGAWHANSWILSQFPNSGARPIRPYRSFRKVSLGIRKKSRNWKYAKSSKNGLWEAWNSIVATWAITESIFGRSPPVNTFRNDLQLPPQKSCLAQFLKGKCQSYQQITICPPETAEKTTRLVEQMKNCAGE